MTVYMHLRIVHPPTFIYTFTLRICFRTNRDRTEFQIEISRVHMLESFGPLDYMSVDTGKPHQSRVLDLSAALLQSSIF